MLASHPMTDVDYDVVPLSARTIEIDYLGEAKRMILLLSEGELDQLWHWLPTAFSMKRRSERLPEYTCFLIKVILTMVEHAL